LGQGTWFVINNLHCLRVLCVYVCVKLTVLVPIQISP